MSTEKLTVMPAATEGGTMPCRLCGERCDPSEMCEYRGLLLCDGCADTDNPEVVAELVRLRDVLAFYADPANWRLSKDTPGSPWVTAGACWRDKGQRARDVLAEGGKDGD